MTDQKDEFDLEVEILIIGSGPCGLGAASRLQQHLDRVIDGLDRDCNCDDDHDSAYLQLLCKKAKDLSDYNIGVVDDDDDNKIGSGSKITSLPFLLMDEGCGPGGLSSTFTTDEGFLFDLGGHVIFSHYDYFDQLVQSSMGGMFNDENIWACHQRVSYVYMKDMFVPYPFQLNISQLGDEHIEDQIKCVNGLVQAKVENARRSALGNNDPPANFKEWILRNMGKGIYDLFMQPYNFKVWAYPPEEMQCSWLGERVAKVASTDGKTDENDTCYRVISNVLRKNVEVGWGPNAVFHFPTSGGTGSIWKAVAKKAISQIYQCYEFAAAHIDVHKKIVKLKSGKRIRYNKMISSIPLDIMLKFIDREDLAQRLRYSSTFVVGIGVRGCSNFDKKCWLYYPESTSPFYRCTIFSNYAHGNCPSENDLLPTLRCAGNIAFSVGARKGPYHSLMFEISASDEFKPMPHDDRESIIEETIRGAIRMKLLFEESEIVSIFYRRLERGYPTPHITRDSVLSEALVYLKNRDIWSRGRFGAWKYEVANQDHSLMQGVEAVDNILFGLEEVTLENPNFVNAPGVKQRRKKYCSL